MMDARLLAGMTATAGVLQLIIMMWTNPSGSALKLVGGVAYCLSCCSHNRVCSSKHILPLQTAQKACPVKTLCAFSGAYCAFYWLCLV